MPKTPARNTLFYGDNLPILREHIGDESVDLVYLDPSFNSNASYNVLFRAPEKMGVFLTLEPPTKGMVTQAAAAGFYKTEYGQFPKIQIVTIEELFGPSNPLHLPWQDTSVFKKAKRETEKQSELDL